MNYRYLPRGRFSIDFEHTVLIFFQKEHKIFNRLIYNMVIFGKPHFSPYGEPPGNIWPRGSLSVNSEHMVFIFF